MAETVRDSIMTEAWVDADRGTVDRRIFSDPDVYAAELDRIFARAWNFMCHETQIPEPGDFFQNYIGEDQVIAVRDRHHNVQVLLNTCPHRGNSVCRAEQGRARSFFCTYHGWNFDLDGRLLAVPGIEPYYRDDLDKDEWGLTRAAQVSSYKGFVFATLDPEAPPLETYLGWVGRVGLDMIAEKGDIRVVDGVQKNRIHCNWKLAVDNLFDWYHPVVSHGSAVRAGLLTSEDLFPMNQMVLLGEYGHAIGGPGVSREYQAEFETRYTGVEPTPWRPDLDLDERHDHANTWRLTDHARDALGPVGIRSRGHPNIFPNLWVSSLRLMQLCLRIPRGPLTTELWWFTFVDRSAPLEEQREAVRLTSHIFGPAGLLEQDDGENWSHSTRGSLGAVSRRRPLNFSMGLGHDEVDVDPSGQSSIETVVNEHGQLWTYRSWQDWMRADSWAALIRDHSPVPKGRI